MSNRESYCLNGPVTFKQNELLPGWESHSQAGGVTDWMTESLSSRKSYYLDERVTVKQGSYCMYGRVPSNKGYLLSGWEGHCQAGELLSGWEQAL